MKLTNDIQNGIVCCYGAVAQLGERLNGIQEVRGFDPHLLHQNSYISSFRLRQSDGTGRHDGLKNRW